MQEREVCGASFVTGGDDPYATECDLAPHGEETPHRGHDPFGSEHWAGMVEWRGGGSAGGDRLPYRDVRWLSPEQVAEQRKQELMVALDASVKRARDAQKGHDDRDRH